MDGRTYYMILGVPRTESLGGIRSAYRDLARKLHPDGAGEQATRAFQEVTEAYDVLSDPQRRRAYNDELRRAESSDLVPVQVSPPAWPRRAPISIFDAAEPIRPSFEHLEALNVEVILTPEERRRGCVLPIGVPVFQRCPECGGSGRDWLFPCMACGQQGTIEHEQLVRVRIPPMARSGTIVEMQLQGVGIHNFCLRLHVFVEPDATNERR
jgi:molecular chaperone DnaJ